MKIRIVRAVLLILGSVAAGYWLLMISARWADRLLIPGIIRSLSDSERAYAAVPWASGIPRFIAAGVAGLSLGYVTDRARTLPWALGLIVVIAVWFYGLQLWHGSRVAGGIGVTIAQMFIASAISVLCLILGRRLRGREPVA